jgi:hypothetical protein
MTTIGRQTTNIRHLRSSQHLLLILSFNITKAPMMLKASCNKHNDSEQYKKSLVLHHGTSKAVADVKNRNCVLNSNDERHQIGISGHDLDDTSCSKD